MFIKNILQNKLVWNIKNLIQFDKIQRQNYSKDILVYDYKLRCVSNGLKVLVIELKFI